jgi:uncharacterized membrane protein YbaN (DUF454 family)
MNHALKALLIICGTLFVVLGIVGMFLPVLPTTPFLLLASACYARSSERFLRWLLINRWCGEYIRNYREGRGIPLKQKVITLGLLWITIGLSAGFAVSVAWVKFILLGVAVGVSIHIIRIKTFCPDPPQPQFPEMHHLSEEPD